MTTILNHNLPTFKKGDPYRLGLDLGTNSIGWAIASLEQKDDNSEESSKIISLEKMGVRIFSDSREAKTDAPLNQKRREVRGQRRRRDRFLARRNYVLTLLQERGFLPEANTPSFQKVTCKNPYLLRAKALETALSPYEFGRVIWHLNQRRGFKSNRKADKSMADSGAMKMAIKYTQNQLQGKTVGQFFAEKIRIQREQGLFDVKTRSRKIETKTEKKSPNDNKISGYEYYFSRELIAQEFEQIWTYQQEHALFKHLLTDDFKAKMTRALIDQRPLKSQAEMVGLCALEPSINNEKRAAAALPSAQYFRLLQDLNHLKFKEVDEDGEIVSSARFLTLSERNCLLHGHKDAKKVKALLTTKDVKADGLNKILTKLSDVAMTGSSELFTDENLHEKTVTAFPRLSLANMVESKTIKGMKTDLIMSDINCFGPTWYDLPILERDAIILKLLDDQENDAHLIRWLRDTYPQQIQSQEHAENVLNAGLEEGHNNLSKKAIDAVLPFLEKEVIPYSEACAKAGYNHSETDEFGEEGKNGYRKLPYYGKVLPRSMQCKNPTKDAQKFPELHYGKIANPTVHVALNQLQKVVNELIERFGKPSEIHVELTRDLANSKDRKNDLIKKQKNNEVKNQESTETLKNHGLVQTEKVTRADRERYQLWKEQGERCLYTGEKIQLADILSSVYEVDHILPHSQTFDDGIGNKALVTRAANQFKGNRSVYEAFSQTAEWTTLLERVKNLPHNKQWRFEHDAMEQFSDENDFHIRQLNDTRYYSRVAKTYLSCLFDEETRRGNKKMVFGNGRITSYLRYKLNIDAKSRDDHRHHAQDAVFILLTDRSLLQRMSKIFQRKENQYRSSADVVHQENSFQNKISLIPFDDFNEQFNECYDAIVVSHKIDHGTQKQIFEETAYFLANKKDIDTVKPNEFQKLMVKGQSQAKKGQAVPMTVFPIYNKKTGLPFKFFASGGNYCYEIYENDKGKWEGDIISNYQANSKMYQKFKLLKQFKTHCFNGKPLIMRLVVNDTVLMQGQIYRVKKMTEGVVSFSVVYESAEKFFSKAPSALQKEQAQQINITPTGLIRMKKQVNERENLIF